MSFVYILPQLSSLDEVQEVINRLSEGDNPYIQQLPEKSGQKEQRYIHLFGALPDINETSSEKSVSNVEVGNLENRITKLEDEVIYLRENLDNY